MTVDLFQKIGSFSLLLTMAVALMAVVHFNQRDVGTKLIGLYFIWSMCTFFTLYFGPFRGKEVNIPQTICGILQFLTLTAVYYFYLNKRYPRFFLSVVIGYLIFSLTNLLFLQRLDINTYTLVAGSFIVLVYCIIYWYRLLVELPAQDLHRVPMFWFNSAFLISAAGTIFLHLFTPYLVEVLHNDLLIYWTFHNILMLIRDIVITVGLWQDLRNIKLRSSSPLAR